MTANPDALPSGGSTAELIERAPGYVRSLRARGMDCTAAWIGEAAAALTDISRQLAEAQTRIRHEQNIALVALQAQDDALKALAEAQATIERLRGAAKLLWANSHQCAIQHHGLDPDAPLPGWLRDTKADIDAAFSDRPRVGEKTP